VLVGAVDLHAFTAERPAGAHAHQAGLAAAVPVI
jgi:hypothetical protein